ncbi:MAG: hypothetical protein AB7G11_03860 [Phycisphaerales bacterium]
MVNPTRRIAWCGLLVIGLVGGCTSHRADPAGAPIMNSAQPKIELLGFASCPNTPTMRENLRAALASIGADWSFLDTDQEKLPAGDLRRGYPTPTVLVNGRDLYGLPVPTAPSMGCRMYPGGVPGANDIADRLNAAAAD